MTTLRQPATEIGARAAALLLEEIEDDPHHQHEATVLLPELIVRGSTLPEMVMRSRNRTPNPREHR
ncbi:MAG: substrate-binding domain-containing protein [Tessaracoccus sp.]|uniref:substrate-binding domain-containing protein n=1 Tax=Tessaracoccus sp. TaxID=1971211 RepID=UPI001ED7B024|nr:substrate-binding domain-containing protein [Tessaracoccus sp.]